jgi:trimethylamine--corrinoid protein Co-methyltransferase
MDQVRYILENHKPDPLPDTVTDNLRAIVEETEKELGVSK